MAGFNFKGYKNVHKNEISICKNTGKTLWGIEKKGRKYI